jgi:hypothetical protein
MVSIVVTTMVSISIVFTTMVSISIVVTTMVYKIYNEDKYKNTEITIEKKNIDISS